jgi:hypothetical protein
LMGKYKSTKKVWAIWRFWTASKSATHWNSWKKSGTTRTWSTVAKST